ncbi:MAG: energy transducer TonB [Methylococcales bacterium]|nr:energy transducer TonB [Methylococcales bacterium]
MDKTNLTFTGYPIFEPSKQELKNARFRGGLMLAVVGILHGAIAFELVNAPKDLPKKIPQIMEVAMVTIPKPEPPKPEIKPLEPPKPVVKKEVVKPIVKPVPVKKITPPKPVLQPKILTTASENAEISIPKFEAAPVYTPPVPVQTEAKSAPQPSAMASTNTESSVSSGGTCENCASIEKRLQRRYARRNFAGSVSFTFTIGEDGKVKNATLKNTEPAELFDEEVISEIKESLMEMEFDPKIVNGKAVSFKGNKTIKFQPSK